jgi:SAM-dependent methyltransferase
MQNFWDQRYSEKGLAYGQEPNDFLRENLGHLTPASHLLYLGAGEGRNVLFLLSQGFRVTALDQSQVGLDKLSAQAKEQGLADRLTIVRSDVVDYEFISDGFDGVISIWFHLPGSLKPFLYRSILSSLKSGGVLLFEAYAPGQIALNTGGPKQEDMLYSLDELRAGLSQLHPLFEQEKLRPVYEGKYHQGLSAVVQFVAKKS